MFPSLSFLFLPSLLSSNKLLSLPYLLHSHPSSFSPKFQKSQKFEQHPIMNSNYNQAIITYRAIPGLETCNVTSSPIELSDFKHPHFKPKCFNNGFACLSMAAKKEEREFEPTNTQFLEHPLALLALVPRDAALFAAGAIAGAAAKTFTAPLDRIKLLMQTHGVRVGQESAKKAIGFFEICYPAIVSMDVSGILLEKAITVIGKEEGVRGYWKGNLPQVIRIIPYSAVQLFAYESYKKLFSGKDGELSVWGRLAAGASAGMTSTLVTYPLDVLRLRLAVEPGCRTMSQIALSMLREEGIASFYNGLGPSLIGIAPYIAVNFCVFDLVKKSLPEKYQNRPETSLVTALVSATLATLTCYPLDTIRRQMQMRGTPYNTVLDAFSGILERDGWVGLYRGFVPNALKNLPNSSIRLTTFDTVKSLVAASEKEFQSIVEGNRKVAKARSAH